MRLLLAALALLSSPAMAWDTPSPTSTSQAKANQHQNQAQGQAQRQNQTANGGQGGQGGNATGGRSSANGGGATVTAGNNGNTGPTLYVPDGSGRADCGGGVGLGAAAGASASGGGTLWEFGDCKRMREAAMLRAISAETGDPRFEQAALNELCQIDRVKQAMGGSCLQLAERQSVIEFDAHKWDYCWTRNAGDKNQHYECTRKRP